MAPNSRDEREARRRQARERAQRRMWQRDSERDSIREAFYVNAEAATNGYMLNRAGEHAGIDPRTLFTGPEARARRYASEELLEYWRTHPRPTSAMLRGEDTRVHERYTAPRRKPSRRLRASAIWRP